MCGAVGPIGLEMSCTKSQTCNDVLHIAYASDERYLKYVSVAIGSAFLWASDRTKLVVDVLAINVDDDAWTKWIDDIRRFLPSDCRIVRHDIGDERLGGWLRPWHGSLATYGRLLLPEILGDVDWCVYADVDTLFTDDPLKLRDVYDPSSSIMGHLEYRTKSLDQKREWLDSRGLPFKLESYFCAGFVLINLNYFREHDSGQRAFNLLKQYPDMSQPDQDALNVVCFTTSKALPTEWGCWGTEAFAEGRPAAIHYPSHNPWTFMDNVFPDYIDAYNIWHRYARYIFGRGYAYYSGKKRCAKYMRMRILGWIGRTLRTMCAALNCWRIPFIGRYVRRHYASLKVWRSMLECMRHRSDWQTKSRNLSAPLIVPWNGLFSSRRMP